MKFTKHDFHWNPKRLYLTESELNKVIKILNTLTKEQIKAVKCYGYSQYIEGREESN